MISIHGFQEDETSGISNTCIIMISKIIITFNNNDDDNGGNNSNGYLLPSKVTSIFFCSRCNDRAHAENGPS